MTDLLTIDLRPEGPLHENFTEEGLREAGVAEELISAALTAVRAKSASAECRRRIYAVASAETQMNMAAASALISSKTASARSDEEKAVLAGLEAAIGWVAAMRAKVPALVADSGSDILADANWPDVPPAAAAIADQF